MPNKSDIEWTDYTSNPIKARDRMTKELGWACVHASPGCIHCYAETLNKRFGTKRAFTAQELKHVELVGINKELDATRILNHKLAQRGEFAMVFVCDMCDLFLPEVPLEFIDECIACWSGCENLTFQILTKRSERMKSYCEGWCKRDNSKAMPPNLWFGVSCENQEWADKRVPYLLGAPVQTRFLSCEPLIGPIDLEWPDTIYPDGPPRCCNGFECGCKGMPVDPPMLCGIHQVIAGGESGPFARPMRLEWASSLRDQCQQWNVPFFFKQIGGKNKKSAGRLLYGQEWNEFPRPLAERARGVLPTSRTTFTGTLENYFE